MSANATVTRTISGLVKDQVPQFVRDDHPNFVLFMQAYFEYLEQNVATLQQGRPIQRLKSLHTYQDIDKTLDSFTATFYNQFLSLIPRGIHADKALVLKHIKDFYRARGTEKSFRFLLRIMSEDSEKNVDFYYPKLDILRASDGKWYIQKTLRIHNVKYDGVDVDETNINAFLNFAHRQVRANTSNAAAVCDKADQFYLGGVFINELTLSSISGTFESGELVYTTFEDDDGFSHDLSAEVIQGTVLNVIIIDGGSGYHVGDPVLFESASGSGAEAEVSDVSSGSIDELTVTVRGAGFRANDYLLFSADSGFGANGKIQVVDEDGRTHPNVYNVCISTISLEANTKIGNTTYTNLNSANANTKMRLAWNNFVFANTGPANVAIVINAGHEYTSVPTIDVIANTRIKALGILGSMNIASRGTGYAIGEKIRFENILFGHGVGGQANISNVFANGAIESVRFEAITGHFPGGEGYNMNFLPTANILTVAGVGGSVVATAVLGDGETIIPTLTTIGEILEIIVTNPGTGYNTAPTVDLTDSGNRDATANATITVGLYSYPGHWINDDSHLSAFNFLQDHDYYQNFSYVVRMKESLRTYKKALKNLLHPAGMKLWAEYLLEQSNAVSELISVENARKAKANVYTPNAIYFDGNTNWFGSGVISGNNSAQGTISLWIKPNRLPSRNNEMILWSAGQAATVNSWLAIKNTTDANSATGAYIELRVASQANTTAYLLRSNSNIPVTENTWSHIFISWTANSAANLLIDGIESKVIAFSNSLVAQYNTANMGIGSLHTGNIHNFNGGMSEFVLFNKNFNPTNIANLALFAANNMPSNSIAMFSAATLAANLVFAFRGNAAIANLNFASTGSFANLGNTFIDATDTPILDL